MVTKMYEMIMDFDLTLTATSINDIMKDVDCSDAFGVNGIILSVQQTIPFIPDEDYIAKVEDIIKAEYESNKFSVCDCKFKGYSKLLEKEIEVVLNLL
jgi:hypothetical protein